MKRSELEALQARQARNKKLFGQWMWWFILPVLSIVIYFFFIAPGYHPPVRGAYHPVTCAQLNAQPDPLDAGGQIAPLCGDTPYPSQGAGG